MPLHRSSALRERGVRFSVLHLHPSARRQVRGKTEIASLKSDAKGFRCCRNNRAAAAYTMRLFCLRAARPNVHGARGCRNRLTTRGGYAARGELNARRRNRDKAEGGMFGTDAVNRRAGMGRRAWRVAR